MYNIWWLTGVDFTKMSIFSSKYFTSSDAAVIMRFNYTQNRELFDVKRDMTGVLVNKS